MLRLRDILLRARLAVGLEYVSFQVIRGTGGSLSANASGMLVGSVASLVLARLAGPEQFGTYAYVMSWALVLALAANLGMATTVVRFVPQYTHDQEWSLLTGLTRWASIAGLICGLIVSVVFAITVHSTASPDSELVSAADATIMLIPATAVLMTVQGLLRSLGRVAISILPSAILRPAIGLLLVGVVYASNGEAPRADFLMEAAAAATIAALFIGGIWLQRSMPKEASGSPARFEVGAWLRFSGPILFMAIVRNVLTQADVIVIGVLVGTNEAGLYAICTRLALVVNMGNQSSNAIAGPLIARAWARESLGKIQEIAETSCWIATSYFLVTGAGLLLLDQHILAWVGQDLGQGTTIIKLLLAGYAISAVTGPVDHVANLTGTERANAAITLVVLALYLVLCVPVVLTWGVVGAAGLQALMVALKNVWTWIAVRKKTNINSSIFALR